MPSYVILGLFVATLVLPFIIALGVAVYGSDYGRYFVGAVGIMLAIGVHASIAYYSYVHYPQWWDNKEWPLAGIYIPALIGNGMGAGAALRLAEKVDASRRRRQPAANVRRLRRGA